MLIKSIQINYFLKTYSIWIIKKIKKKNLRNDEYFIENLQFFIFTNIKKFKNIFNFFKLMKNKLRSPIYYLIY